MSAKRSQTGSGGFTAAERAAMKQRAGELRAEGRQGAKKADGLQAALDSIAKMAPEDRAVAERVHATVSANAPRGCRRRPGTGCPPTPTRKARSSSASRTRANSTPGIRHWSPGRCDPRRRGPVARVVRGAEVEPRGRAESRRTGEGRGLLTSAAIAARSARRTDAHGPRLWPGRGPDCVHRHERVRAGGPRHCRMNASQRRLPARLVARTPAVSRFR